MRRGGRQQYLIIGHIRARYAAHVMRELHKAGVGGITCYRVHGMSGEKSTFLHSKRPIEIIICPSRLSSKWFARGESIDKIVRILAQTGEREILETELSWCRMSSGP